MNGWREFKLGNLCVLRAGGAFKTQFQGRSNGDYPFIKVSDMNLSGNQFCIHKANNWIDEKVRSEMRAKPFPEGTTVFAKIGEALKQNRVRLLVIETLIDNNMMGAIPNRDIVDPRFLFYKLANFDFAKLATGTALPYLTVESLTEIRFTIPPLPTQRNISWILSTYDDLIENNTRRIQVLEEMARRIYEEWFVRFRFPGFETVKIIKTTQEILPEKWSIKSVSDFGKVVTGKTPSKSDKENFGLDVPFLKLPDMHGRLFCINTSENLSNKGAGSQASKFIPPNSLCVSCIGTAGIVNINAVECQTNQQINSLIPEKSHNREFLYFALSGLKELINQYGANGATMVNLNKAKFESLPVIFPEEKVVKSFHQLTYPLFQQILNLQKKNDVLLSIRDLLLPKLISGEIDVSNISEPMGD